MAKNKFNPLQALRQGNVPTNKRHVSEYAKLHAEEVINTFAEILRDEDAYARDRIQAGAEILNRAYGKAKDGKQEAQNVEGTLVDLDKLPTSELVRMIGECEAEEAQVSDVNLLEGPKEEEHD